VKDSYVEIDQVLCAKCFHFRSWNSQCDWALGDREKGTLQ